MESLAGKVINDVSQILPSFKPLGVLAVGAEAALIDGTFLGWRVVAKYRYPKPYRNEKLDVRLRSRRTAREAKLILKALSVGVPVPAPILVDVQRGLLVIEKVEGERLKESIDKLGGEVERVFRTLGVYVGRLHQAGMIHGDLTTSNVILRNGRITLIDFGLGDFTHELEAQGVDLHLFLRALESTHPSLAKRLFSKLMDGYERVRGRDKRLEVENKIREIRMRGRYVVERRRKVLSPMGEEGVV